MEKEKNQETPKRPEIVKIPPQRGQIKARIFKEFAQKVKNAASLIGLQRGVVAMEAQLLRARILQRAIQILDFE